MTDGKKGLGLDELKAKYNPAQEVAELRAQVKKLEERVKAEKRSTGEARLHLIGMAEGMEALEPVKMSYKPTNRSDAPTTYVLHLTDLHNGEVTDKDEVEGFGEFNPEVFDARLERLGNLVLDHVRVQRAGYNIPRLHVIGTGDYISGDIHQELQVTNAYPTPVQATNAGDRLAALLHMLAPHFERVTSDWITLDNHGRLTRKNQASEGGENNWGYVVAHAIKARCAKLDNVDVRIHAKPSTIIRIGAKERFLAFHGHQIKGWAGIPYYGFERRVAMEATKRLGVEGAEFTKLIFGHFHISIDAMNFVTGGSLSGTNAFDHSCGRHSPAHQTSFMVDEKHGMFGFTRWWLA